MPPNSNPRELRAQLARYVYHLGMGASLHAVVMPDGDLRLPPEAREQLELRPGQQVEVRVGTDRAVILKPRTSASALAGMLKSPVSGVTLEDMDRAIIEGATRR